jgi:glycosyltransferase involved in cell wall biosynthesis
MPAPLVSVVIPTHNRPHFLAQAIDSVRAQTFTDYEIIVVSNGERADPASRSIAAGCCSYFQLAEDNPSRARNVGVEHAQGEWIAFLDDDDLWLPHKLERQLAAARLTNADMVACDYVEFFPDGREVERRPRILPGWSYTKAANHLFWWAAPTAVMVRKSTLIGVAGFDPDLRYGEDGDLWRRISWRHQIHQMDDILVRVRKGHPSLMQHERARLLDDIRHYAKMRRDTPIEFRATLPASVPFIGMRLVMVLMPRFLYRPAIRAWLRPRTRLNALRSRLRIRTRARQLLAKLRAKERTPDETDRREDRIERTLIALSCLLMGGGVLALMLLARP